MKKEKLVKDPRKRKMLLVLPMLIIPFLTMAFWALGGGNADASIKQKQSAGLNLQLPNAQLKDDKGENKLSYYEAAEKDSAKWREGLENDLFLPTALNDSVPGKSFGYSPYPLQTGDYRDPNEQKVYQKLAELNSHLQSPNSYRRNNEDGARKSIDQTSFNKDDVDRLEEMMKTVSSPGTRDPEVDQLNGMMERILDIQHPERVTEGIKEKLGSGKQQALSVDKKKDYFSISLLDTNKIADQQSNDFYCVDEDNDSREQNAIEAVVHETQSLVDGTILKMRLLNDITINGSVIPTGNFVFGKVSLQGERLYIEINSIRNSSSIYPVKLTVYDLDGMEGLYIPGAITRDVAKQSTDNSLQNIEMTSIDPSLKVQVANAGITAAKTLLNKKTKLVRVTVKDGYKILLKQKSQQ